ESKFGGLSLDGNGHVKSFVEKATDTDCWINAGYFICEPEVFDYITEGDSTIFEKKPLENLAKDGKMTSYKHKGFWKPMDTLKDNTDLNEMWDKNKAPWKVW
ncbi:MAG: sugar phosphate nucleotidyltransferase, partial [Cetobacterium sp.]